VPRQIVTIKEDHTILPSVADPALVFVVEEPLGGSTRLQIGVRVLILLEDQLSVTQLSTQYQRSDACIVAVGTCIHGGLDMVLLVSHLSQEF
jgi:hypothetical protein